MTPLYRPAVIISFAIAAVSALLSALCYAEFATEVPITGGAFSYTTLTFGPLVGWQVAEQTCFLRIKNPFLDTFMRRTVLEAC